MRRGRGQVRPAEMIDKGSAKKGRSAEYYIEGLVFHDMLHDVYLKIASF
jgi:hypothetical protein